MLLVFTLAAGLLVTGYVHHQVGAAGTPQVGSRTTARTVPSAVSSGGPIVLSTAPVRTVRMPARTIALTFDDGPDPKWTPRILAVLRRHHVPATFFVIGARAIEHPGVVHAELTSGAAVGLHTFTHNNLAALPAWRRRLEIDLTEHAIARAGGVTTRLLRPPYSSTPDAVDDGQWQAMRWAAAQNLVTVLADRDGEDWRRPGVGRIVRNAEPDGASGAVVLLHDGGGERSQTVAALERIIVDLQRRGDRFTTVSAGAALSAADLDASHGETLRGTALLFAVKGADIEVRLITVLLLVAGALSVARALALVAFARRHVRRSRASPFRPGALSANVIIPAFNEAVGIAATVQSIAASHHPNLQIIVVDDGSEDDTAEIVQALQIPNLRVLRQANAGKAAALQAGIDASHGDIVVLVDGDTVFEPETVRRLIAPFDDPAIGAVAGNTKVGNRGGLLGRWQHLEYVIGFNLDRRLYEELECMPTVPGAIGAFRRSALQQVGGVPQDTLAEDTDLTIAVLRAGWRIVYVEKAVAWTEAPASLRQLWLQRYRWCYGTLQAMWKHRHAVIERGAAGRFGRRGLPYLLLFQVLLPLFAPVVDLFALYGLVFLDPVRVSALWLAFLAVQLLLAAYALRLDGEKLTALWALPLQQFVYRQLMYLIVIHSIATALSGVRVRWQKLPRSGLEIPT
jgi:cellulose synthase/poly-beta-1,6-N-acetylglucosamine synthase-like glycosyltransferase/peptidoglycan/xylan/chitin deacetylase (PgdA/CDA1 family)